MRWFRRDYTYPDIFSRLVEALAPAKRFGGKNDA
jgi:hypothetical protein